LRMHSGEKYIHYLPNAYQPSCFGAAVDANRSLRVVIAARCLALAD
jgi:hypothetical protein